jgi:hypothetical protein
MVNPEENANSTTVRQEIGQGMEDFIKAPYYAFRFLINLARGSDRPARGPNVPATEGNQKAQGH